MTASIHPERIARLLLTTPLPSGIDAAGVVELVDAGASRSRVYAAAEKLVGDAWAEAGREAAAATKPRQVKAAQEKLRGVAALELLLGLGPVTDSNVDSDPETDPVSDADSDTDPITPAVPWSAA
ncbi:MAG: hypothetical protein U0R77_05875 [Mycolicibacterium insubricum]|nr:hypothetical protein [Mycobacterium sp.]